MSSVVDLVRSAVWLPENYEDSSYIAEQSGLPEKVVREKMGIVKKCRAQAHEHPSMMAVEASKKVLEGIDPDSVDMILWTGSEYKDYPVWSAGIFVQRELGLKKAHAFDLSARCSTNVLALRVAKSLMTTDPAIRRVLLCGGHRTGDLVNYRDPNARFLYNLSDGGSAMLLEKREDESEVQGALVGESSLITDGDFSLDVIIPGAGTKRPAYDNIAREDFCLQVPDVAGMRERLAEKSISNFLEVIKTAALKTTAKPIDYLALLHMKRSAHDGICQALELKDEQSIYMDHYGHFGAPDQVLSLGLAEQRRLLKTGDHVVMASAGIGYTWSAISLVWKGSTFNLQSLS